MLKNKQQRDEFLEYSNNNGVMTRPAWKLLNTLNMYKKFQSFDLDNAKWLQDRIVNIPSGIHL